MLNRLVWNLIYRCKAPPTQLCLSPPLTPPFSLRVCFSLVFVASIAATHLLSEISATRYKAAEVIRQKEFRYSIAELQRDFQPDRCSVYTPAHAASLIVIWSTETMYGDNETFEGRVNKPAWMTEWWHLLLLLPLFSLISSLYVVQFLSLIIKFVSRC